MTERTIVVKSVGVFGRPGTDGVDGTDGADGATGATGPAGPTGATGATGTAGSAGAAGTAKTLLPYAQIGSVTVGTGLSPFVIPSACTIVGAVSGVSNAPTGAALIVDINKNGTTIYSDQSKRPTIADGQTKSQAMQTPGVTALAAGDVITVDRDQIGSTDPGINLVVTVELLIT